MRVSCANCHAVVLNGRFPTHEQGCLGHPLIFTNDRGRKFHRYEWINYDVWGNRKDGFEVNDKSRSGVTIMLPDDAGHADVIRALKGEIFKSNMRLSSYETEWQDESLCYVSWAKTGEPLGELEAQ